MNDGDWRVARWEEARHGRGGRIRTRGLRFWRPLLYQPELHPCATPIYSFYPIPLLMVNLHDAQSIAFHLSGRVSP